MEPCTNDQENGEESQLTELQPMKPNKSIEEEIMENNDNFSDDEEHDDYENDKDYCYEGDLDFADGNIEKETNDTTPVLKQLDVNVHNFSKRNSVEVVKFKEVRSGDAEFLAEISQGESYKYDKATTCVFCHKSVVNFSRHLETKHCDIEEVSNLLLFPKNSKDRRIAIKLIRNRGNFASTQNGIIKPVKRLSLKSHQKKKKNYAFCVYCQGHYVAECMYKHVRNCWAKPDSDSMKAFKERPLAKGQSLMAGKVLEDYNLENKRLTENVLKNMKGDQISEVVANDPLILAYGQRVCKKTKHDHLSVTISNKMRELARLLIEMRSLTTCKTLIECLKQEYYFALVKATKNIAGFDEKQNKYLKAPSLALHMGTTLKSLINLAADLVRTQHPKFKAAFKDQEHEFKNLIKLIESSWQYDVSSVALQDLEANKWEKPRILPIPSDVQKFSTYVNQTISECLKAIKEAKDDIKPATTTYQMLTDSLYASVLVLNRRRVGELQRVFLEQYQNGQSCYETECDVLLNDEEKNLLKTVKRIEVRGKKNKPVPILFTKEIQSVLDVLMELRPKYVNSENRYLFAVCGTEKPVSGYNVIDYFASRCGAKYPERLTSTNLRKNVASHSQILNMTDSDRLQLSDFMGHTAKTHSEFYRMPQETYQKTNIMKLLLVMAKGITHKFKGKSLNEIQMSEHDLAESSDDDENEQAVDDVQANGERDADGPDDEQDAGSPDDERDAGGPSNANNQKETNVRSAFKVVHSRGKWTKKQKDFVLKAFHKYVREKKCPGKKECEALKHENPIINEKSWVQIKTLIFNTIRAQK